MAPAASTSSGNAPVVSFRSREKSSIRSAWRWSWQRTPSYFSSVHTVSAPMREKASSGVSTGLASMNRTG